MSKLSNWYGGLTKAGKVAAVSTALLLSFGAIGTLAQPSGSNTASNSDQTTVTTKLKVEVKPVVTTEPILFTSSTVEDPDLDQGVAQTRIAGANGVLTHTYQVTYTNGVETSRSAPVDTITTQPINEVIAKGTQVSTPFGATAICSDGTYSFSQNHRGTCSHHGGVAEWL